MTTSPKLRFGLSLLLLLLGFLPSSSAQDWTDWLGPSGGPTLRARLRDKDQNAKLHIAAVEVEVNNIWLHSPDVVPEPGIQLGVLQYQLDHCSPVVTTDTRLRFQDLTAGKHVISVGVLGLNNDLLTPKANLKVTVP